MIPDGADSQTLCVAGLKQTDLCVVVMKTLLQLRHLKQHCHNNNTKISAFGRPDSSNTDLSANAAESSP